MNSELHGILGAEAAQKLGDVISRERATNPPRIAVIGKAGVGKTTTINNLFSARLKVSHALRGTSEAGHKEFELRGGGILHVVDMPGLGEGLAEDAVFEEIYREELPKVDVVLYVMQASERILGEDQRIFSELVVPALQAGRGGGKVKQLVVGLNKVDLMKPVQWDERLNYPEPVMEKSIQGRCQDIARHLRDQVPELGADSVNYYSAEKRYRLDDLMLTLVEAAGKVAWKLPKETADPFELADPDVQEFVARWRAEHGEN
ncbi:GTPase [Kineosporia sp. NBRC 101677]|uniref:GTPase family protein n=1 Tax=Kineosporia sp. NBRC 101677 TaxID=3032197 RepID=UPI002556A516|nr:GTPase [Kineosporia sp. NBRC 101677]